MDLFIVLALLVLLPFLAALVFVLLAAGAKKRENTDFTKDDLDITYGEAPSHHDSNPWDSLHLWRGDNHE